MGLTVLSLCDGISTGQQVLKELNIEVDKYFSSEIEKSAMTVAQYHFPNTIQIGDIFKVRYENGVLYTENGDFEVPKIDLILSGTPCVSFSVAGKNNEEGRKENMSGVSGELFYEFVRILNEVKPTYFFFENVKMREDVAKEINEVLGVPYIYLNSADFSCHIRKRYYWTNIVEGLECISEIYGSDEKLKDILEDLPFDNDCSEIFEKYPYLPIHSTEGVICITPRGTKMRKNNPNVLAQSNQRSRIYDIEGKCPTICATLYDLKITKDHKTYRRLTITECERLQGLPDGYTSMITKHQAGQALGNGWQVDTVKHILKFLVVK